MSNESDFNLIFGIMIGAILSVFGNLMVTEIYRLGTENQSWIMVGITTGAFLLLIFVFFYILWKMHKQKQKI